MTKPTLLTATERVVLRIPIEDGFVSESELNPTQIKTARDLLGRKMLSAAGTEPDGTKVYKATASGVGAFKGI